MTGVANGQVVDNTRYLVGQFQVGINIEMTTHANSQRIWGNTHLIAHMPIVSGSGVTPIS